MRGIFKVNIIALLGIIGTLTAGAVDEVPNDSVIAINRDSVTAKPRGIINRVIAYFDDSNKEHKDKPFDISFIGGPHYSNEKKLGLGLLAAGVYSTNRADSLTPPSNVSLYGDISTSGFYSIGVRGTTRFRRDTYRLNYNLYFESMPYYFWGIGYANNSNNSNKTSFKQITTGALIDFLVKVHEGLYVGPVVEFTYIKGKLHQPDNEWLWRGEKMHTFSSCIGAKVSYDTRDNLTAPHHGLYALVAQRYYGKWMGNDYPFSSTEFLGAFYTPTWRNCTLAAQYHMLLTYGDTPWGMLAQTGGSYVMRGYYEGRYRDKGEMDLTVELRQRVYRRIGVVAWGGVGTIFPRLSRMNIRHLLPNYGVGARWEFKKNVNVRFDIGFGKGEKGFVFNINEAF